MTFLKLTTAIVLSLFLMAKADPNPGQLQQQETKIALNAQRIDGIDKSLEELKPLIPAVASLKQTVETDHQLLMGIGIAIIINMILGAIGKLKRPDLPEPPPERVRSHAAGRG